VVTVDQLKATADPAT